jgi:hypothetical protein
MAFFSTNLDGNVSAYREDDEDDLGPKMYAEYERLLSNPDELQALASRLGHPESLTQDQIMDEARCRVTDG